MSRSFSRSLSMINKQKDVYADESASETTSKSNSLPNLEEDLTPVQTANQPPPQGKANSKRTTQIVMNAVWEIDDEAGLPDPYRGGNEGL